MVSLHNKPGCICRCYIVFGNIVSVIYSAEPPGSPIIGHGSIEQRSGATTIGLCWLRSVRWNHAGDMRARVFVGLSVAGFEGDCAPVIHQDQGKRGLPPKALAPLSVAPTAPSVTFSSRATSRLEQPLRIKLVIVMRSSQVTSAISRTRRGQQIRHSARGAQCPRRCVNLGVALARLSGVALRPA